MEKIVIGRKDRADFPDLGLRDIDIKIDTGAYTSSIHCEHIEEKHIDGDRIICFRLLDRSHPEYNNKLFQYSDYSQKKIRNSFGDEEMRYVIKTRILLFGQEYSIDLTLSERGEMKYPVLIGRKLLDRRFIVDPQKTNLSYRLKMKNKKSEK